MNIIELRALKNRYSKKYYQEHKDEVRAYHKQYDVLHHEEILANKRKYYQCNRTKILKEHKLHRVKYLTRERANRTKNYRSYWSQETIQSHRRRGFKVLITRKELLELAEHSNDCYICGRLLDWSPDKHQTIPTSPTLDRVDNETIIKISNVKIACHRCNTVKRTMTISDFIVFCKTIATKFSEGGPS